MKVIAAGSFTIDNVPTPHVVYLPDNYNPGGSTPYNIPSIEREGSGSYIFNFTVPTSREGLDMFRWYVQSRMLGEWAIVEWLSSYRARVKFYSVASPGVPVEQTQGFSVLVVQELPDSVDESLGSKLVCLASFDENRNQIATTNHPLGPLAPRGIIGSADANYHLQLSADTTPGSTAYLVWYEAPSGSPVLYYYLGYLSARESQMTWRTFDNLQIEVPAGPWHIAGYKFGRESPTSLSLWDTFNLLYPGLLKPGISIGAGGFVHYADGRRTPAINNGYPGMTWESDNTAIFTVPDPAICSVTGVAPGTANLLFHYDGLTASLPVTVYAP